MICPEKGLISTVKAFLDTSIELSNESSGSIPKLLVRMGVLVRSGLMQLMRMLKGSHSWAMACTKLTTAALVAE